MIYVFIALLIIAAFLILGRQKKLKQNDSMQLIQCFKCGTYVLSHECRTKNGKYYCKDCISSIS